MKNIVLIFTFIVFYNSSFSQENNYNNIENINKVQFNKMLMRNGLNWDTLVKRIRKPTYIPILDYIVDTVYANANFSANEKDMICFYLMGAVTSINRTDMWQENKTELKKFEDTPHDKMKAAFLDKTYKKIKERRHIKDREYSNLLALTSKKLDEEIKILKIQLQKAIEDLNKSKKELTESKAQLKRAQDAVNDLEEQLQMIKIAIEEKNNSKTVN